MLIHKDQFPITIQAYDISGKAELFIAEQLVNSQAEVDNFSNKYAGKLIKAKGFSATGATAIGNKRSNQKSSAGTIILVVLLILIVLAAIGFYTGWIQRNTGISL